MAKRIEFIAPVEAMRGNLSGRQNLLYAENDNKAYYGPVGSKNYARNYTTRFVGAKRASDGRKFFIVRTKTANHLTPAAKYAMALLGGTGAIVAAIMRNKTLAPYVNIMAQYIELQQLGEKRTFRAYVSAVVRAALSTKSANIAFTGPRPTYNVVNPWVSTEAQTVGAEISTPTIWKFADELCPDSIKKMVLTYNGAAGDNVKVVFYADTEKTWLEQITNGAPLANTAEVDGLLAGVLWQAAQGQQIQIGVGGPSTLMRTVPVWSVDGEDETAVMDSDMPSIEYPYAAHAAS